MRKRGKVSKIEIILPVYLSENSLYPIVERCIGSLNEFYPDMAIHVVDDGSPLPFPSDWIDYITTYSHYSDNRGYTAAVNFGLESGYGETLIVANDDLTFKAGDLDRFYTLPDMVIASPADTASSPDDRFGSIWGLTRKTYEHLGPLDARYKHFFSDREYYDRAKEMGVDIVKWHDVVIDHVESGTYKTVDKEKLFKEDMEAYGTNSSERTE